MQFPQYLWRIGTKDTALLIRRGNTINEPMEKFDRKDRHLFGNILVGILDYCEIDDAKKYSETHHWDWMYS